MGDMWSLQKKVALVTGAGSGIGKCIALTFAKAGATVVVNDLDRQAAFSTAKTIEQFNVRVLPFQADVSDYEQVKKMASIVSTEVGGIDILVNNAGIAQVKPFVKLTEHDWDVMLSVNLKSVFNCISCFVGQMIHRRRGRIINISSVAAMTGSMSHAHYAAAKGGVIGLTKSLAREFAKYNITVNAIAPSHTKTPMTSDNQEVLDYYLKRTPMGRIGRPEDIASASLYLASDAAGFVTGQVLSPNGGFLI